MRQPKLVVKNLSKTFFLENNRPIEIIDKINLKVFPGEIVSLIGPSGCGKSTIFNIISGVEEPTSGTISLDGNVFKERRGRFGYMFQQPLLLPWRTVEENLILGLDIRGFSKKTSLKKARLLLKQLKLDEFSKQFPSVLSGGMRQRVAFLRTVLFNDSFLLLDEPFGAIDRITRLSLQLWLLKIFKKIGATALFITHDIQEAILLSNRIVVLSKRPAKIIKEINVPLPYPRNSQQLASNRAINIEKKLLSILSQEQS